MQPILVLRRLHYSVSHCNCFIRYLILNFPFQQYMKMKGTSVSKYSSTLNPNFLTPVNAPFRGGAPDVVTPAIDEHEADEVKSLHRMLDRSSFPTNA